MQVYKEEMAAQKVLYRGFGSQKPGGVMANFMDFRDKPVANTSMLEWGGKLYALWEAHNPFVLDPNTLETLGEETFGEAWIPSSTGPISVCDILALINAGAFWHRISKERWTTVESEDRLGLVEGSSVSVHLWSCCLCLTYCDG